jgi:hypothetical protein
MCVGVLYLIDAAGYGPDPQEVATEAREVIRSELAKRFGQSKWSVRDVSLVRKGRTSYTGLADVTIADQPERLILEVLVDGGTIEVAMLSDRPKGQDR